LLHNTNSQVIRHPIFPKQEVNVTAYQLSQEWNDLHWGTVMPVTVMINSKLEQVRARGSCSLAVIDPERLEAKVPDPETLVTYMKSLIAQTITDMLGERSGEVSDITQLTAITAQTIQMLQTNLASKLIEVGLQLKNITIETIESV
jgi:membrane protease subunit (stomatin/prohibitin family)